MRILYWKDKARHGPRCRLGGDSEQSNATTSSNSSDTNTSNVSTNTTTNTSYNTTDNNTNTVTQDRRLVNDHGIGVSADASTVLTMDSGNSTNTTTTNNITSDMGAVSAGMSLGMGALQSNRELAMHTVDASKWLSDSGRDMLSANIAYAEHLGDSSQALARSAISEVVAASGNALNQVTAIAAKPLNANDPQRLVIIVALGVVGMVFFSKMKA